MEFEEYVHKPYVVRAIQLTKDNMEELAPLIGVLVRPKRSPAFIEVDRKKVPVISKVFAGYWITDLDGSIRCYSPRTFREQFDKNCPEIQVWVDWLTKPAGGQGGAQAVEA